MKNFILYLVYFATFIFNETAFSQGFDFNSPNLDKPQENKNKNDLSLGSFGGLNFGILFDARYEALGSNAPGTLIHVNELNITGNIGDNISLLAEQLLPTSRLSGSEDQVGDDHGFVYAIFSNISFLPSGTAFKIGRFRYKWGIDAVLDAPTNPIYPLVRKNLGFVTDKGIELSGFFEDIDYTLGLADGPDYIESEVKDSTGHSIGLVNTGIQNNSLPLLIRISTKVASSKMGISYFDGKSYGYTNFMNRMPNASFRTRHAGGMADRSMLYYRQHGALDYLVRWDKFDLALEYSKGLDRDLAMGTRYHTTGYFSRIDYTIKPQSLSLQLQFDQYRDGHNNVLDEKSLSSGLQIYIHDQAFIRIGYIFNRLGLSKGDASGAIDNIAFTQFYLPL